jgi:hypothetical protein
MRSCTAKRARALVTSHDGKSSLGGDVSTIGVDEINGRRHWRTSLSDDSTLRSSVAHLRRRR